MNLADALATGADDWVVTTVVVTKADILTAVENTLKTTPDAKAADIGAAVALHLGLK